MIWYGSRNKHIGMILLMWTFIFFPFLLLLRNRCCKMMCYDYLECQGCQDWNFWFTSPESEFCHACLLWALRGIIIIFWIVRNQPFYSQKRNQPFSLEKLDVSEELRKVQHSTCDQRVLVSATYYLLLGSNNEVLTILKTGIGVHMKHGFHFIC